jgi:hypothetical protein
MTAVDWLIKQMFKQGYFDGNKPLTFTNLDHLQQEAKEMERQQVIDAANWNGYFDNPKPGTLTGEQYYNQTFKKDKL